MIHLYWALKGFLKFTVAGHNGFHGHGGIVVLMVFMDMPISVAIPGNLSFLMHCDGLVVWGNFRLHFHVDAPVT